MARDGVLVEVAVGDAGDPLHLPEVGVNLPAELVESFLHLDVENIRGELPSLLRLLLALLDDEGGVPGQREADRAHCHPAASLDLLRLGVVPEDPGCLPGYFF